MLRRNHSKWVFALTCFCMLLASAGCRKTAHEGFPPSGAAGGWDKASSIRTFAAADLWQYVDGQAEQYVQAGVVSASTAEYAFHNRIQAVVDIFTMNDSTGARTLFVGDKAGGFQTVSLGDEAVAFEQSITFRKGRYLVRIVAYEQTPETAPALIALAHSVESRL